MFEYWPVSLLCFGFAALFILIVWYGKKTGEVFFGLVYPPFSKKTMPEHYHIRMIHLSLVAGFFVVLGLILLAITPESSTPKLTREEIEELVIGTWEVQGSFSGQTLTLTLSADHTCKAIYNNNVHNGTWSMGSKYNTVVFNWDADLVLPHPIFEDQTYVLDNADYSNGNLAFFSGSLKRI